MGRLLFWLGALLFLFATPCAAQADLFLDPRLDPPDVVASRVRLTLKEVGKATSRQAFEDGESMELVRERSLDATWVRTTREVAEKRGTAFTYAFEAWTLTRGKKQDTSLAGKEIAFTRQGERFAWTAPEGVELSSAAKGFLAREAERLARPMASALLPAGKKAVFEGTSWSVHAKKVSRAILPLAEPDPKKSKVEVKLAGLEGKPPVAKLQAQATLQLGVLPGTDAKVTEGGVWQSGIELTWRTDRPRRDVGSKHVATFKGAGKGAQPDGREYSLETSVERTRTVKVEPVD